MNKKILIESIVSKIKKTVINERKSDEISLILSRKIINAFKNKKNLKLKDLYFERGDDYAVFDLVCNFIKDEKMKDPFSIDAGADMEEIDIEITYNPEYFPKSMSDLVAEVKETLEHELEHVEQQNFQDMEVEKRDNEEDEDLNFRYLTSSVEIPAYVRGFIKRAKTKRISLDDAMEEWYDENQRKFENKSIWPKVKKIWKKHAEKMRNKGLVKKYK